jgi:outer membrane protein assembly factor BamB
MMSPLTLRRTAAAASLLAAGQAAQALEAPAEFRGDAAHTGVYAAPATPPAGTLKWRFHTEGAVVASPAVAGDSVYIGSADHQVYALDRRTGAPRWKFATRGRVSSSPAVADGVVYVGSYDGKLYAIDAATGKQKWAFATEGERRFAAAHLHGAEPRDEVMPDVFDFFLSSPVVAGGSVYFGSGDRHVYALDAADGRLRWKTATAQVVHASPALADGLVVVGDWGSTLLALDAATGAERWRFQAGRDDKIHNQEGFQSSAAIADGLVFVGCRDSHLYALDLHTGAPRWNYSTGASWVISSPAVRDGRVYFATSDTGLFIAVDARTGKKVYEVDNHHWPMFSSPALAGARAYIGTHQGRLLAIDLEARKPAWTFETEAARKALAELTKPDGTPFYERAFSDFFYDDMVTGTYRMLSVGAMLSSPVVADGTVFVGSMDGDVYAVD